jgi:predicted transglutaminase-like cysteine proteinase
MIRTALAAAVAFGLSSGSAFAIDANPMRAFLPIKQEVTAPAGAVSLCAHYDWACAPGHGAAAGADVLEKAAVVNRAANAAIRPISDLAQYRVAERWTLPSARGGDCEDYAIYKKQELIRAGVSPDRLLLATVLDRQNKAHAVLVLRTEMGDFVLDNVRDKVLPWHRTGYVFLRMQNPQRPAGWVSIFAEARGR